MKPRLSGIQTHNVHDYDTLFAKGIFFQTQAAPLYPILPKVIAISCGNNTL
jgi:hypothetical protein